MHTFPPAFFLGAALGAILAPQAEAAIDNRACIDEWERSVANAPGWRTDAQRDLLCREAANPEPVKCYSRIQRGGVNWGGSTTWEPGNAAALCKDSQDADQTIRCFTGRINAGADWKPAIDACANQSAVSARNAPSVTAKQKPGGTPDAVKAPLPQISADRKAQINPVPRSAPSTPADPYGVMSVTGYNLSGQPTVVKPHWRDLPAALSAFTLKFHRNEDHKISRFSMLQGGDFVLPALNDNDGNDNFAFTARYLTFLPDDAHVHPLSAMHTIVADCRGVCQIPMGAGEVSVQTAQDQIAILAGFSFERSGYDANIRRVAVSLDAPRQTATVAFTDDAGKDLLTEGAVLSHLFLPGESLINDAVTDPHGEEGAYRVTLQYFLAPRDAVIERRMSGGNDRQCFAFSSDRIYDVGAARPRITQPSGASRDNPLHDYALTRDDPAPAFVLQGFDLSFTNSDHYISGMNVSPSGTWRYDQETWNNDWKGFFCDKDSEDPIRWSMDYAVFKRPD